MTATAAATPRTIARLTCPVCDRPARSVFMTSGDVAAELAARDRFFAARLTRPFSRDLTDTVLGTPAAILRCSSCGVLVRDAVPGEEVFRDDRYDDGELEVLHQTHVRAFTEKEADYRPLLPPGARVAEIGCYAGGFLSAAAQWGWRATGVDIGRDVLRFCRDRGLDVRGSLDVEPLDAMFIWNCFEQLAEPDRLLAGAFQRLRAQGLLVIRIPDADFYAGETALPVLAWNGLLGWPHRYGYGITSLRRLVRPHGFAFVRLLRRPAIRPLREAMSAWAVEEEARAVRHGWIEVTFRKGGAPSRIRTCDL